MQIYNSGISVIVPTHNFGQYIRESVLSILAQTLQPAEVIIVDDGSTDDTATVVKQFDDPRIKYIYQAKSGVSAARNRGLGLASGRYIAFLDSDDRWRPGMLEAQFEVLERNPELLACFTNFIRFSEEQNQAYPDQFKFYPELATIDTIPAEGGGARIILGDAFDSLIKFGEFPAYLQCLMFRRASINGQRFNPELIRCQDADFFLRAIMGRQVAYNSAVLAEVRRHGTNATRDTSLISEDKLKALLAVRMAACSRSHFRALNARIARAQVEVAMARIAIGRTWLGVSEYLRSIFSGRPTLQKLRGLIKVVIRLSCRAWPKKSPSYALSSAAEFCSSSVPNGRERNQRTSVINHSQQS